VNALHHRAWWSSLVLLLFGLLCGIVLRAWLAPGNVLLWLLSAPSVLCG